jgi:DNA-binding NarL/FixJ family response regulator
MADGAERDHLIKGVLVVTPRRVEAEALLQAAKSAYPDAALLLCQNGRDTRAMLETSPAFLGLIAMELPDVDGLDLGAALLAEACLDQVLSVFDRPTEVACEFFSRESLNGFADVTEESGRSLAEAIGKVGAGFAYASYPLGRARALACAGRTPLGRLLSSAERLVFSVIGDGSDDLAASTLLGLSIHTLHTHRRRIMAKLGLKTRAELIREAVIRGVVRFGPEGVIRPGLDRELAKIARRPSRSKVA